MNTSQAALARMQQRANFFALVRRLAALGPLPTALLRRRRRLNFESAMRRSLSGAKGLRP